MSLLLPSTDSLTFSPDSNTPVFVTTMEGALLLLRVNSNLRIGGVPVVGSWTISSTAFELSDTNDGWLGGPRKTVQQIINYKQ